MSDSIIEESRYKYENVLAYLKMKDYSSSEKTIGGIQTHYKVGNEPIFTRSENGFIVESTVRYNILNKTGDSFDFFLNILKLNPSK